MVIMHVFTFEFSFIHIVNPWDVPGLLKVVSLRKLSDLNLREPPHFWQTRARLLIS